VFVVLKRDRQEWLQAAKARLSLRAWSLQLKGAKGHLWRRAASILALPLTVLAVAGCRGTAGAAAPPTPRFEGMTAHGLAAPDFALRDQAGRLVRLSDDRGRYVVVTFLYVHCKDVCPIIAGQLNTALRDLGPARGQLRVLAVSVDPRGDTPAAVRHFIAVHRLLPEFRYLTGTQKTLLPVWDKYHVASTPSAKGLLVSHTAVELLLDRTGKPRVVYDSHITAAQLVHDLNALGLKS
jgi:protein SCO1/2